MMWARRANSALADVRKAKLPVLAVLESTLAEVVGVVVLLVRSAPLELMLQSPEPELELDCSALLVNVVPEVTWPSVFVAAVVEPVVG